MSVEHKLLREFNRLKAQIIITSFLSVTPDNLCENQTGRQQGTSTATNIKQEDSRAPVLLQI